MAEDAPGGASQEALYEVDDIIGYKQEDGKDLYLVKWKGFEQDTWEPTDNIGTSMEGLKEAARDRAQERRSAKDLKKAGKKGTAAREASSGSRAEKEKPRKKKEKEKNEKAKEKEKGGKEKQKSKEKEVQSKKMKKRKRKDSSDTSSTSDGASASANARGQQQQAMQQWHMQQVATAAAQHQQQQEKGRHKDKEVHSKKKKKKKRKRKDSSDTSSTSDGASAGAATQGQQQQAMQQWQMQQAAAATAQYQQQQMQQWQQWQQWQAYQQQQAAYNQQRAAAVDQQRRHEEEKRRQQEAEQRRRRAEEAERSRKREEGTARDMISAVIKKIRVATPETLDSLRKELEDVCKQRMGKTGSMRQQMEKDKLDALEQAKRCVFKILEVRNKREDQERAAQARAAILGAAQRLRHAKAEEIQELRSKLHEVFEENIASAGEFREVLIQDRDSALEHAGKGYEGVGGEEQAKTSSNGTGVGGLDAVSQAAAVAAAAAAGAREASTASETLKALSGLLLANRLAAAVVPPIAGGSTPLVVPAKSVGLLASAAHPSCKSGSPALRGATVPPLRPGLVSLAVPSSKAASALSGGAQVIPPHAELLKPAFSKGTSLSKSSAPPAL